MPIMIFNPSLSWIKNFVDVNGQQAPDDVCVIIPDYLNVTNIYKMYKEEMDQSQTMKYSTFFCETMPNKGGKY